MENKMDLEYCKDFAKKRNRWLDFWNGKNTRAMVTCERPKAGAEAVSKPHSYHLAFGDINEEISKTEAWVERTEFLADSIPYYQVTFTPDHFSLFLGAELGYNPDSPDTTWVEPFDRELKDIDVRFDPESKWWKRTAECMEAFQEHFRGKIMTVATHLQGGVDCLAALRGPQNFLFDIMDHPDLVKEKLRDVNTAMMDAR